MLIDRIDATIVSGLAEGIGTAAHTEAIAQGGRTIAVLATPPDRVCPQSNHILQRQIQEEHLCISQLPVGSKMHRGCFPERSRTMALLSDATVIIEATENSRIQCQGWEALRLGRRLYIAESLFTTRSVTWAKTMESYGAEVLAPETLDQLMESLPPRLDSFSEAADYF